VFDEIQPDESGANYTTIHLPKSVNMGHVKSLLQAAIQEAAQAAIG
jgi:hypothetical protein